MYGMNTPIYCAIGDIHGELDRLKALHENVIAFTQRAFPEAPLKFIHLGDLVDRGPDSCGVVDYLMAFEAAQAQRPVTLRGNHEQMMIDALSVHGAESSEWAQWIGNGGHKTMESYADKPAAMLARHLVWLRALPTLHTVAEEGLVFVHAGIDPDCYPDCGDQVRLWTRSRAFMDPHRWTAPALQGQRVVHGHTPTRDSMPESAGEGRRLNIDTGAVYGGQLTAVLLRSGARDVFFHT